MRQLVANDRAGEVILDRMVDEANVLLEQEGVPGTIHLFKNNLDSAGNSFGCHENYLVRRRRDFQAMGDALVPFFITRQILTGAGHIRPRAGGGATYAFSQRADQMWDAMSSATTRSRPIINTRDEPHGDADLYRRMHVIVGDSSVAETTTMLKVGMTDLLLGMLEDGVRVRDLALAEPMRAIREISHDTTATVPVELASGRRMSALAIQEEFLTRVTGYLDAEGLTAELTDVQRRVLELWERGLRALREQDPTPGGHRAGLGDQGPAPRALPRPAHPRPGRPARGASLPGLPRHLADPRAGHQPRRGAASWRASPPTRRSRPPSTPRRPPPGRGCAGSSSPAPRSAAATSPWTGCT